MVWLVHKHVAMAEDNAPVSPGERPGATEAVGVFSTLGRARAICLERGPLHTLSGPLAVDDALPDVPAWPPVVECPALGTRLHVQPDGRAAWVHKEES